MRERITAIGIAAAIAAASGNACAMSTPEQERVGCRVVGGDKLPADAGGADALCRAIEQAVSARVSDLRYSVDVRVLSASALAATIRIGNRPALPEQRMATMDRTLSKASIERFAQAIATETAKAARR